MATSIPKAVPKSVPKAVPPAAVPAAAKEPRQNLFLILTIVLLVLGAAGGAWYYFAHIAGGKAAGGAAQPLRIAPPVFVTLDPFTVNLLPEDGEQYLQVAFTLQVAGQNDVDQIKLYMPQVRSRVLMMLSNKRSSELLTGQGKNKLSEEIINQIKKPFHPQGTPLEISDLFFTSFVIQ